FSVSPCGSAHVRARHWGNSHPPPRAPALPPPPPVVRSRESLIEECHCNPISLAAPACLPVDNERERRRSGCFFSFQLDNRGMSRRLRRKAFQSKDKEKDPVVYQTAECCSDTALDEYGKANSSSSASATISIDDLQPRKRAAVACHCSTASTSGSSSMTAQAVLVDWTSLPDDTVLQVFSRLNYRDRASLASSCRAWRNIGSFPCLWQALDLRAHRCDTTTTLSLASRCSANLRSLRFRGSEAAAAVMNLQARGLREISGDFCRDITDAILSVMAARHELLESLQIGPDPCEKISSDAIRAVALCCPRLKRLRLSGVREIDAEALNALGRHCECLEEIALLDCGSINEAALASVVSVRFLSVAGTRTMNWAAASLAWSKQLYNLIGLDVSRTDVSPTAISRFLVSSKKLKVLCALNCSSLEEEDLYNPSLFVSSKGKLLLALFTDIFSGIASLFCSTPSAAADASVEEKKDVFEEWRTWNHNNGSPKNMEELVNWLEWILSHTLLRIAETNPQRMDEFWLRQGTALLLSLVRSSQEDVQERAATGLATFVVIDDENATVDAERAEAVMRYGGIPLLLDLARSFREGIQSEAAKAIANLSVNTKVAKTVADEGGIGILSDLARSMNRLVAEEAAGGLWNLSVGEEHKGAIAEAGGIKALVDLIFKWPSGIDGVLERAAGALANLAADDKCSMEVAMAGGVHALVMLARTCKVEGVQEQVVQNVDANNLRQLFYKTRW
ncbi:hypothetical protein Taro_004371, partial [Colocasia esculenta]|nr:hypothetical protein [Colocasia esculenta]